jgi:ERCC4-related helicase
MRDAQLLAAVEALLHNTVVVMPTGTGKTLVASAVMRCISELNPQRSCVMVVDRIPLVHQQRDALVLDTGMLVLPLCSENKTAQKVKKWVDNFYDAVVVTAGTLVGLLEEGVVSIDRFSVLVFDECHHATGLHDYSTILAKVRLVPPASRPRLLGLSASPFSCTTFEDAAQSMAKLREQFLQATICR